MIEQQIAAKIQEIIGQPDVIEWIADGVMAYLDQINDNDETRILRDRLAQIEKEKNTILSNMTKITLDVLLRDMQANYEKLAVEESSLKAKLLIAESKKQKDISREHVIAFCEEMARGSIDDKKYQETLIDTFLVKAYLYDDHFKLVINFTGDTNEVEVPLEVEENIDAFEKVPENTDVSPDDSVRIGASQLHQKNLAD